MQCSYEIGVGATTVLAVLVTCSRWREKESNRKKDVAGSGRREKESRK